MADHPRATPKTFTSLTPVRVITAVFAFGLLAGAGIAAWLTPPGLFLENTDSGLSASAL